MLEFVLYGKIAVIRDLFQIDGYFDKLDICAAYEIYVVCFWLWILWVVPGKRILCGRFVA